MFVVAVLVVLQERGGSGVGAAFFAVKGVCFKGLGHPCAISGSVISAFSLVFFRWNLFRLYVSPLAVLTA